MKCAYCQTVRHEDSRGLCCECGAPRTTERSVWEARDKQDEDPYSSDRVKWGAMLAGCSCIALGMRLWKW